MRAITYYGALFCVLAGLVSCGVPPLRYKEPEGGSRTRVRFVTNTEQPAVLRAYGADRCTGMEEEWMRLRVGYLINSVPKRLDMPLWHYQENAAKEVYVTAEAPLYFMFFGSGRAGLTTYSCAVPFSYQFDTGVDYEVSYYWMPNQCSVEVSRLAKADDQWLTVHQAHFQSAVSDSNRECLRKFSKLRLY
jgi:hypothetical protein